jgi:hypothetical protein
MAALAGLTGLYGPDPQDTTDVMDEGVLEAKGFALNPEHGEYGSQHLGYQGIVPDVSPFSSMGVYEGYDTGYSQQFGGMNYNTPGEAIDATPETHSSPYPRGIIQQSWDDPHALARYGEQANVLHQPELGGSVFYNGNAVPGREEITHYTTDRYDAPNENYLAPEIPGQVRPGSPNSASGSGGGNADPTQGYGVLNTLPEFQMGHSIRRVQHDSAHFDYTNTHGEQDVPFYARHPVGQMPLDGPDSPYFAQGSIDGANVVWEGRIGDPTPYQQPAEPSFAAATPASAGSDVWAWG